MLCAPSVRVSEDFVLEQTPPDVFQLYFGNLRLTLEGPTYLAMGDPREWETYKLLLGKLKGTKEFMESSILK